MGQRGETGWGRSQPAGEGEGKLGREPRSVAQAAGREPPDLPPQMCTDCSGRLLFHFTLACVGAAVFWKLYSIR